MERGRWIVVLFAISALLVLSACVDRRQQMERQEVAAIFRVKEINIVQQQYKKFYQRYATALAELGPPKKGEAYGPNGANMLEDRLASGQVQGYVFTLKSTSPDTYTVNANPKVFGATGRRCFFSDQTMVIRQNEGSEPATANSPELD
jgi:type IV pilus assembly protein PilA